MKKQISGFLLATTVGLLAAAPALSDDEASKLDRQVEMCREGTQMIVNGASDDAEEAFYRRELASEGWRGDDAYYELLTGCVFYKMGYVDARNE